MMLQRLLLLDQIDLILQNNNILELHDLDRGEVLARLRLRARLVARDEQQRGVHHRRAVQHRRHQDVVPRAVHERDVAHELHARAAPRTLAWGTVLLVRPVGAVAPRARARFVFALVDLCTYVPWIACVRKGGRGRMWLGEKEQQREERTKHAPSRSRTPA